MTALTAADQPRIRSVVTDIEKSVSWIDKFGNKVLDLAMGSPNGPTPLSVLVDHGVRPTGALGGMPGGREFDLPYRKSTYVTRDPLPAGLRDGFVDLVDRAYRHEGLKVVFQGVLGGGKFQENGTPGAGAPETTRMEHRDALLQIVFDVFYKHGHADVAEQFQDEMRRLWARFLPLESGRMFWGTYEDAGTGGMQLDMGNPTTQAWYYDSSASYAALRQIKALIDPHDVFHTSFTVRP